MADVRSVASSSLELPHRGSWWRFLLPIVWLGLGARLFVAVMHDEPFSQDFLSLALVAFFMTTAMLGSRVWLWLHDRFAPVTTSSAARS